MALTKTKRKNHLPQKYSAILMFVITYMSMPLVPLIMLAIIYTTSHSVISEEILRSNNSVIQQLQYNIDSRLAEVEQLTTKIALDSRLATLLNLEQLDPGNRYLLRDVVQDYGSYEVANPFVDRFYVYLRKTDVAVTPKGTYDAKALYDLWNLSPAMNYDVWLNFLSGSLGHNEIGAYTASGGFVTYTLTLPLGNSQQSKGVISAFLRESSMQDAIDAVGTLMDESVVLIVDQNDTILFSSNPDILVSGEKLILEGEQEIQMNWMGREERVHVSALQSEHAKWKYLYLVPEEIVNEKLRFISNLLVFGIVLSLVIAGLLTAYFAKMNYNPIQKLIGLLQKQPGYQWNQGKNEYLLVQDLIDQILQQNTSLTSEVEQQSKMLRSHFVSRLLSGNIPDSVSLQEIGQKYGLIFTTNRFIVFLFEVDDWGKLFGEDADNNRKTAFFAIENVSREMFGPQVTLYPAEMNGYLAMLVNYQEEDTELRRKELLDALPMMQMFIRENLDITFSVGCSQTVCGISEIAVAYEGALDTLESKAASDRGQVLDYETVFSMGEDASLRFSFQQELKYEDYLRAGDYDSALMTLDNLLDDLFRLDPQGNREVIRYRLMGLAQTTWKAYSLLGRDEVPADLSESAFLEPLRYQSPEEYREYFHSAIGEMKRYRLPTADPSPNARENLVNEIQQFIKEHYQDVNLGLSMLSTEFGLSEANISKIFRKNADCGLLVYIHRYRIQKAKELLRDQGNSIKIVAERTGFSNSDALIRVFKKYEGITPGMYQERQKGNS